MFFYFSDAILLIITTFLFIVKMLSCDQKTSRPMCLISYGKNVKHINLVSFQFTEKIRLFSPAVHMVLLIMFTGQRQLLTIIPIKLQRQQLYNINPNRLSRNLSEYNLFYFRIKHQRLTCIICDIQQITEVLNNI